jgi:tRNA A37 N6-isopentenylltransferase MiaA
MSLRAALQSKGMVALLEAQKAGLEEMIRERFRSAREAGTMADVRQLSASLRQVKASLKAAMGGQKAA